MMACTRVYRHADIFGQPIRHEIERLTLPSASARDYTTLRSPISARLAGQIVGIHRALAIGAWPTSEPGPVETRVYA
jgi:hypothetical protein